MQHRELDKNERHPHVERDRAEDVGFLGNRLAYGPLSGDGLERRSGTYTTPLEGLPDRC